MIKRRSASPPPSPSAPKLSDAVLAELNGRPADLMTAPHDPDSETAWMAEGNCRLHPPSTFFPSDGVGVDRARKICRDCPVSTTCLEYALEHRIDHGVWGGCSERERRRILTRRRAEAAADAAVTASSGADD